MVQSNSSQAEIPFQKCSPGSGSLARRFGDKQELSAADMVGFIPLIRKALENRIALNKWVGLSEHFSISLSWGCAESPKYESCVHHLSMDWERWLDLHLGID